MNPKRQHNPDIKKRSFKPSKAKGQNFLVDDNIARKIVRLSGIDKSCGVLEVGPGMGALTGKLNDAAGHVTAVELDMYLAEKLREMFGGNPCVTIIQGDILKTDIAGLAVKTLPENNRHVCANLPYSITTPAITHLLESGVFGSVTVMVQREVAKRMCAAPGSSDYGAFSVFVNYHAAAEILFDIPPECFSPRPKVTSSVVKMAVRPERRLGDADEKLFFRVVRAAFSQRRKTLVNALYAVFQSSLSKEEIKKIIEDNGFDANIRGEMLSVEDFIKLSSCF